MIGHAAKRSEGERKMEKAGANLGVLHQIALRRFPAGELDAINATLLTRANSEHHPVLRVTNRVGLRFMCGWSVRQRGWQL